MLHVCALVCLSLTAIPGGTDNPPPFGTVLQEWELQMSGSYAGAGITWRRDSGRFYLLDQEYAGEYRVWSLDPARPDSSIARVPWVFANLGSPTLDIPWGIAWNNDSGCFWMGHILDGSVYNGCCLLRYVWNGSAWAWGRAPSDSWLLVDTAGGSRLLWLSAIEKWLTRDYFVGAGVRLTPDPCVLYFLDPHSKTFVKKLVPEVDVSCLTLVPWDSAYILTCDWNADSSRFCKLDSLGRLLESVPATHGAVGWSLHVPRSIRPEDTVCVYCINSHAANLFQRISTGMLWSQLTSAIESNVRPDSILAPAGTVDSGQAVIPRLVVRNTSSITAEDVDVHFVIDDEMDAVIYHDSLTTTLPPRSLDTLQFSPWIPTGRDSMGCMAWTFWTGDSTPEDDTLLQRFLVRVIDVGITEVYNPIPGDTIDPGEMYPSCAVWNYGNTTVTFPVVFSVDTLEGRRVWEDTTWVYNLLAGGSRTVTSMHPWDARAGVWRCTIWTPDTETSLVFYVRGTIEHDAAVERIDVPTGVIDTTPFQPRATIRSSDWDTVWVFFDIQDTAGILWYSDSLWMMGGGSAVFRETRLTVQGPYAAKCSCYLEGDQDPRNDVKHANFRVSLDSEHEVIITEVLVPTEVPLDTAITPAYVVLNTGQYPETFRAWFHMSGRMPEDLLVSELPVGAYETLSFLPWQAQTAGWHQYSAWLDFPPYDTLHDSIYVFATGVVDTAIDLNGLLSASHIRAGPIRVPEGFTVDILDPLGRLVMHLRPGINDLQHISPGVYLLRLAESGQREAVFRKVILH